jgi:serine protease DegQ
MLKKLWLLFAQAITLLLAVLFILASFRPEWLPKRYAASGSNPIGATSPSGYPSPGAINAPALGKSAAQRSYSEAALRATPAVVNVNTSKASKRNAENHPLLNDPFFKRFFGDDAPEDKKQAASLGSGVIVSSEGFVLTNHHVIDGGDEIEVTLADGRSIPAKIVGSDPETDLAVLKLEPKDPATRDAFLKDLPVMALGSIESARVGDVVLAIGNPFGIGQTVTMGIVSALGRTHLGINTFENFIQTDAAINPGNSGGALIDSEGRLLGINTAIYSRSGGSLGIGFAIPISTAKQVMDQLIATGAVTRGFIGVEPQDLTPELAEAFKIPRKEGAVIAGIMKDGPAAKAGVQIGDILVDVNGKAVLNTSSMLNTVAQLQPDNEAKFKFIRDGKELVIAITVGKRPKAAKRAGKPE